MKELKLFDWDKKPRTMLRHLKPGHIFAFSVSNEVYGFGRVISQVSLGHVVEFFDFVSSQPELPSLEGLKRLNSPLVLDSYSLFDRKAEGEWRVIGYQDDFVPANIDNIFFVFGDGAGRKKVDVFGNEFPVSLEEAKKYQFYSPAGDEDIKRNLYGIT